MESVAPLMVMLWPELHKHPDLEAFLQDLTVEEIQKARDGLQELAEPARERRGFRRNRKGHLKTAFAEYTKKQQSP